MILVLIIVDPSTFLYEQFNSILFTLIQHNSSLTVGIGKC